MPIKYTGPFDAVEVAGQVVKRGGDPVDLGDLEPSLLEQADNWQAVKAPSKKES